MWKGELTVNINETTEYQRGEWTYSLLFFGLDGQPYEARYSSRWLLWAVYSLRDDVAVTASRT